MTMAVSLRGSSTSATSGGRRERAARPRRDREALPPLTPRRQMARAALVFLFMISLTLLLQLVVVSGLQQSAAQQRAFERFRADLAKGSQAIGPADENGKPLATGTPVAYLEIPTIDVRQVIVEGTTPAALFSGPGHRRDTPLPGQFGTSVLYGRRAAFGGPFSDIESLREGDSIKVTTGQGVFTYTVIAVRTAGSPMPAAVAKGGSRVTMVTAAGTAFMPSGTVSIDADLKGTAVGGPRRLVSARQLPAEERAMAGDARTMWALALWLQALIVLSLAAVWGWHRWGRAQAWVVFLPALLLVGLAAAGEAARLLPNLL